MNTTLDYDQFLGSAYAVPIDDRLYWENMAQFQESFEQAASAKNVLVYLDSCGGDIAVAERISAMINEARLQGRDVRILTGAECQSAAMTVLTSVPVECRYAGACTRFMIHSARYTDPDTNQPRTGLSRRSRYRICAANNAQVRRLTCGTRISEKALCALLKTMDDAWFPSDVALDLGLVNAIV